MVRSVLLAKGLALFCLYSNLVFAQPFALNTEGKVFTQPVAYKYNPFLIINCDSSVFVEEVSFFGINSFSRANFSNAWFKKRCSFKKSKFPKGANFSHANFLGHADFGYLSTENDLNFNHAHFFQNALFWMGVFGKKVDFTNSKFEGDAILMNSSFESITFKNTTFLSEARFDNSLFLDELILKNIFPEKGINLDKANLGKRVLFENFKAEGVISFKETTLPDTLEFININSSLPIDLDHCIPRDDQICLLYLENIDLENLWVDFRNLTLWFPSTSPLSNKDCIQLFKELIMIEENRKREESCSALKKQYDDFLKREKSPSFN